MIYPPLALLRDERQPFMAIFAAYFDESGKHKEHPVVTFSGVCASTPKVQRFEEEWESLLRRYGLKSLHMVRALRPSVKLSDQIPRQSVDERIEALKPFVDCVNDYLEIGIMQAWDVKGFFALPKNARAKLGNPDDPYYTAFIRGVIELVDYVQEDDRISLICDDDMETAWDCYRHYRGIRRVHESIRKKTVSLTFADDRYFPALQAADMASFLIRLEAKRQFYGIPHSFVSLADYLTTGGKGKMDWRVLFADEKMLKELADSMEKLERKYASLRAKSK